jgi:hypothetical protein
VRYGKVRIESLIFQVSEEARSQTITVLHNRRQVPAKCTVNDGEVMITLGRPVVVKAGESLSIRL